jgi:putative phage-type endonuclease
MKRYNNVEQKSDEWHHLRKGKITGTTLKAIMGTPKARQDALYEIIAERLTVGVEGENYENAMERGNRLEADAIAMFEFESGKQVERTGFCEDETNPFIANSPDGLIGEDEAVEAKCMGGKNHVKMWLTNKVPDEYEWQVVQYFVVNEKLRKLYFIGYNPDIPAHPLHIIEVYRDQLEKDIQTARENQEKFISEVEEVLKTIIEL